MAPFSPSRRRVHRTGGPNGAGATVGPGPTHRRPAPRSTDEPRPSRQPGPLRAAARRRRRSPSPATTSPTGSRSRTTRSPLRATPRRSCAGPARRRAPRASSSPASTRTRRRRPASGTGCSSTSPPTSPASTPAPAPRARPARRRLPRAATTAASKASWAPPRRRATRCTATTSWCTPWARRTSGSTPTPPRPWCRSTWRSRRWVARSCRAPTSTGPAAALRVACCLPTLRAALPTLVGATGSRARAGGAVVLYVAVAVGSFRRYSTYTAATLAGIFTNSVFGVIIASPTSRSGAEPGRRRLRRHRRAHLRLARPGDDHDRRGLGRRRHRRPGARGSAPATWRSTSTAR